MNEPVAASAVTVKLFPRFSDSLRQRAIGAVFCGLLSLFLTAIFALARIGFPNPARPLLAVLAISWVLILVPFALFALFARDGRRAEWYTSEGFLTLAAVVVLGFAGWLAAGRAIPFLPVCAVAGLIAALWLAPSVIRSSSGKNIGWFLAAAAAFSIWLASVEWANGYLSPMFIENLIVRGGDPHFDTLFHTGMSNMLNTYGIASIGLNGAEFTQYHFGSAWLFGQLANVAGMSAVDFYQLGVPVIMLPFFFRGLFILAAEVADTIQARLAQAWNFSPAAVFLAIACAAIGFFPPSALHAVGFWEVGPFLSESHVLALSLALMVAGVVWVFQAKLTARQSAGHSGLNLSEIGFVCLFIPIALSALGFVKVSQMVLLVGVALFLFIRLGLYRRVVYVVGAILMCIAAVATYRIVVWPGYNEGIVPLSFLRSSIPFTWWPVFPILHLVWTWAYTYVRLKAEGAKNFSDVRALLTGRRIVDVEAIVFLALIGLGPGSIYYLPGASLYFSDVQRWFALGFLLAYLPFAIDALRRRDLLPFRRSGASASISIDNLFVSVLAAGVLATMAFTGISWAGKFVRANMDTRRQLQEVLRLRPTASLGGSVKRFLMHPGNADARAQLDAQLATLGGPTSQQALQHSRRYEIVKALIQVGARPRRERRESLLYVDPALTLFWDFIPYPKTCEFSVMVGPALSGTALLDGVPAGCKLDGFYGTDVYRGKPAVTAPQALSPAAICMKAKGLGFNRIVTLLAAPNDNVALGRIDCSQSVPLPSPFSSAATQRSD